MSTKKHEMKANSPNKIGYNKAILCYNTRKFRIATIVRRIKRTK